jgi:hypothetical protein
MCQSLKLTMTQIRSVQWKKLDLNYDKNTNRRNLIFYTTSKETEKKSIEWFLRYLLFS